MIDYHTDPEAETLVAAYRSSWLALLKNEGSERAAKRAEDALGTRLSALGLNEIQVARVMREIVKQDVVPLHSAHLRVTGQLR